MKINVRRDETVGAVVGRTPTSLDACPPMRYGKHTPSCAAALPGMASPLRLDPLRIKILPDAFFTRLLNDLLHAEAGRRGIPPRLVDTTAKEKAPDGGVDALVADHPATGGDWLPEGASAWQYKSGACPPLSQLIAREFTKPEVRAAIARGDAYVFCTADSIAGPRKAKIQAAIAQLYVDLGRDPKGRVYTGTHLGRWIAEHLGIAATYLDLAIEGWQPFAQWAASERLSNEFISDRSRDEFVGELRRRVDARSRLMRVVGDDGLGKTRTVLEALREAGLTERVLYLSDGASIDPRTFWQLRHASADGGAILVVDECPSEVHARLQDSIGPLPTGFSVIAIGPRPTARRPGAIASEGMLELGPLSNEAMAAMVSSFAPTLSAHEREAIAARTKGVPKLLVLVAQEIARSHELVLPRFPEPRRLA